MQSNYANKSPFYRKTGDDDVVVDSADHLKDREVICEAAGDFLESALTSSRHGLVFRDSSVGTSGVSRNHLLLSLLRSLDRPWEKESGVEARLVARALQECPDQLKPYLATLDKVWEPRDSDKWMQV